MVVGYWWLIPIKSGAELLATQKTDSYGFKVETGSKETEEFIMYRGELSKSEESFVE